MIDSTEKPMVAVRYRRSYVVLNCRFCGGQHWHGTPGHKTAHCRDGPRRFGSYTIIWTGVELDRPPKPEPRRRRPGTVCL